MIGRNNLVMDARINRNVCLCPVRLEQTAMLIGCRMVSDSMNAFFIREGDRCGGEGFIEYADAGPSVWGEDTPSEKNHLVTCPQCYGTGLMK